MSGKNILFVSHEDKLFGASKSLLNIIDVFSKNNNCIVVTRSENGDFAKELKKRGVEIIPARYYTWEIYKDPKKFDYTWWTHRIFWVTVGRICNYIAVNKIVNKLKYKIDIVHVNSGVVDIGVALKDKLNCPLVWHLREFGFEDFGYVPYLSEKKFYSTLDKADGVIAISDAIYTKFNNNLKHAKIKRIYNGVAEDNIIENKQYHLNVNDKLVLLISGSKISKAKGQDIAINAIKMLNTKKIENLELRIAGYGDLKELGVTDIPKNVKFLGHVDDMKKEREHVDVELVCSKCEAFGRVTVEAMLGGIPVIGARTGGTPELINDGINGFTFEYGDIGQLAEKILFFYNNRNKLLEMGNDAQKYAKKFFLINRCAKEIEEFYNELL